MDKINILREHIDQIDSQIVGLLNMRMAVAEKIGSWKMKHKSPIFDLEREAQVMNKIRQLTNHPILKEWIKKIYQPIMDCTKASQFLLPYSKSFPIKNMGIIGWGLMGGSIAKALRLKFPNIKIYTCAHDSLDFKEAMQNNVIDGAYDSLEELVDQIEMLVLATPISTIIPLAKKIAGFSKQPLYIIDIASVKKDIVEQFEKISSDEIEFIGTHPMAGIEKSGFKNSFASMFANAPWIIVPHRRNTKKGLQIAQNFIELLGAKVKILDGETHDDQAALISQLPTLISASIWNFVHEQDPKSLEVAGPGFKSVTRLAHENPLLTTEIIATNRVKIEKKLSLFLTYLEKNK